MPKYNNIENIEKTKLTKEEKDARWIENTGLSKKIVLDDEEIEVANTDWFSRPAYEEEEEKRQADEKKAEEEKKKAEEKKQEQNVMTELRTYFSHLSDKYFSEMTALDAKGHLYNGPQEIAAYLKKKEEPLYIYLAGDTAPYAAKNENGLLKISDHNVLPEDTNLKLRDHCTLPSKKDLIAYEQLLRQYKSCIDVLSDTYSKQRLVETPEKIFQIRLEKRNKELAAKGMALLIKPEEPKQPAEPPVFRLSAGEKAKRFFLKFFTIGIGETEGGRKLKEYQNDLADWKKKINVYHQQCKKYEDDMKVFRKGTADLEAEKQKHITELKKAMQIAKDANTVNEVKKKCESMRAKIATAYTKAAEDLRAYHSKTEVRLLGLKDLRENGLTADNLFANTWLLAGRIEGKCYHPQDTKNKENNALKVDIAKYLISAALEHDMHDKLMNNTYYRDHNDAENDRTESAVINEIQAQKAIALAKNPETLETMLNSTAFKETLYAADIADQPINPGALMDQYMEALKRQPVERKPYRRFTELKNQMIYDFGKKPILTNKDELIRAVAKLNIIDEELKHLTPTLPGNLDEKKMKAFAKNDSVEKDILADLQNDKLFNKNTMDHANSRRLNSKWIRRYINEDYYKALYELQQETLNQFFENGKKPDKEYSLKELQGMLNQRVHENQLKKQEQAEAQQNIKKPVL